MNGGLSDAVRDKYGASKLASQGVRQDTFEDDVQRTTLLTRNRGTNFSGATHAHEPPRKRTPPAVFRNPRREVEAQARHGVRAPVQYLAPTTQML